MPPADSSSSKVSSDSDSSEESHQSHPLDEEMSESSDDCDVTLAGQRVEYQDVHYYSDNNDDDFASAGDPFCKKTFGIPAISCKDKTRLQLSPIIKLLHEKRNSIATFLRNAKGLSDVDFKQHFRIEHRVANHLIWLMETQSVFPYKSIKFAGQEHETPLKEVEINQFCFLLFLWYLSSSEPLLNISRELDIPPQHLWPLICRVATWIRTELNYMVSWPVGARLAKVAYGFFDNCFRNCIGAISSTQIPIKQPSESGEEYLNKDGYYSVHLQVVAASDHSFTNIYCGDGGSLDDARVWKRSPLRANAKMKRVNLDDLFPNDSYLVGTHPYDLEDRVLFPYKLAQGFSFRSAHRKYNLCHFCSCTRVETALNQLKGRFRRLMYVDYYSIDNVPDIINACCILHNHCLLYKDTYNEDKSPFNGLKRHHFWDEQDNFYSTRALPKMEIGNDRRGRVLRKCFAWLLDK